MAYTPPVVSYATVMDGTYTALTGIQSVSIRRGRQRFQDPFSNTVCVIELIPANSYTTPLEIGQYIDVRVSNSSSARAFFTGRISDVERDYSFPYNSVTGAAPADRIVITCMGALGALGQTGNAILSSPNTDDARNVIVDIVSPLNVYMDIAIGSTADVFNLFGVQVTVPAGSDTANLDYVNYCLRAGQAFIDDVDMQRNDVGTKTFEVNAYKNSTRTWTFSDSTTGAGIYKYNNIVYLSGAENAFNEINVTGYDPSLATQSADDGSAPPFNSLQYRTQLNSTGAMATLAEYIVDVQNETLPTPYIIKTNTLIADGIDTQIYMNRGAFEWFDQVIGATVSIQFRGTTSTAQVQGLTANFYLEYATFEFHLSPSLGIPFILDSTLNGVLDTNRLGYP
jgi:hypothetical protein